ncbi:MAG: hypothetical protein AAF658_00130, partial [Myxococcota bacterium]
WRRLPSSTPTRWVKQSDGKEARRHSFVDYFEALGVDLAAVSHVEMKADDSQVVRIAASALRSHRDDFLFAFTRGDRGKVLCVWPKSGFATTTPEMVKEIHLFTKKES